jgi:predicted component of type VI protein secretion system
LSAADSVILKELNNFLDARNQRRELKKQLAYNAEKAEADRLDKYLKDALARDPELAKAFKQAKAFVDG